jgi:SAM-dependent methyltransferase
MQMAPKSKQTAIAAGPRLPRSVIHRLRCPVCRSKLRLRSDCYLCQAAACRREFPLKNGIPILIDSRLSVFEECSQPESNPPPSGPAATAKRLAAALLPSLGRNIGSKQAYAKFAEILLAISTKPKVLVVGGATIGAGLETILKKDSIEFIESDVYLSPRTALVCDAHQIPFEGDTFDGVIVQAVLEHVADPAACVEEIHRVLKPRGLVYSDTPFMQQVHAAGHDFSRFTHVGHRRLFRKFDEVASGVSCGPGMALAWAYQYFLLSFVQSKMARAIAVAFARLTGFWLKYLDYYLIRKPGALDAASAYYFLGMKARLSISDRQAIDQYRGIQRSL